MISALSGFTFAIDVSIFKFTEKKKVFSYVIVKVSPYKKSQKVIKSNKSFVAFVNC